MATAARNQKVRNVVNDPRVALALQDGGAPVVAEGVAVVHRDGFPTDVVARLAAKDDGWDVTSSESDGPLVLLEVAVTRWLGTGHAA